MELAKFKKYKCELNDSRKRDNCKKKVSKYKKMRQDKYGK